VQRIECMWHICAALVYLSSVEERLGSHFEHWSVTSNVDDLRDKLALQRHWVDPSADPG